MPAFGYRITPVLWYDGQAEEAVDFYVTDFPDSSIGAVTRQPDGTPLVVEVTLFGHRFAALNGRPQFAFMQAASFVIDVRLDGLPLHTARWVP